MATVINNCSAELIVGNGSCLTYKLEYPRYIHSELMTHRAFSRNATSSRACPLKTTLEKLKNDRWYPAHIYQNCPGMVGKKLAENPETFKVYWDDARDAVIKAAESMSLFDFHKQHINRILEPFLKIKVIVTATDWDNFFNLRLAEDAEPEMRDLAMAIQLETRGHHSSEHFGACYELQDARCGLPFVTQEEVDMIKDPDVLMRISGARCARISYKEYDGSDPNVMKDLELANRLLKAGHMSPFEHPTVFMDDNFNYYNLTGCMSYRYIYEH